MRSSWALLALAVAASVSAQPAPRRLALVGGMLLDGYEVPPLHHAAILIEGNRIVWVGRAAEARIPKDATVVDTSGRAMLPGLIDLHAHLMILGHGNYDRWFPWIAKTGVLRVMEISAKQLLHAGVTTAVDLSAPLVESLSVRDRIKRGEIPGPRMLMSGPWITERLASYPPEPRFQVEAETPDQAYAEAERLAKSGVDVIKAYPMSRAHYAKLVEAAHKHGLKVHAHVYAEEQVRDALEKLLQAHRQRLSQLVDSGKTLRPIRSLTDLNQAQVAQSQRECEYRKSIGYLTYAELQAMGEGTSCFQAA